MLDPRLQKPALLRGAALILYSLRVQFNVNMEGLREMRSSGAEGTGV